MDGLQDTAAEVITCPLCGGDIEPLRTGIAVFAMVAAEQRSIGGLKAYRCRQYAHIFFVKAQDVETLYFHAANY